jgi:O-antigen ligase
MLMMRVAQSGVPSFKGTMLRTYLTRLTWGSSNYVSAVLVLCMPAIVLAIRLTPRGSGRHWTSVGTLIASLVTPLLTVSRGGFLLSAAYLLSLAARVRRSLAAIGALAGVALLGTGILMLTPFGRGLALRFTDASSMNSVIARVLIWEAAWKRGLAHLPFGVGAGQGPLTKDALNITGPHNFLLELFSELGVPALILWLWMFATLWSVGRRLRTRPDTRFAGQAMIGTLVLAFFNMLFEPTLSGNLYHLLFWWLIGIFYGSGPLDARTADSSGSKS